MEEVTVNTRGHFHFKTNRLRSAGLFHGRRLQNENMTTVMPDASLGGR